MKGLPAFVYLSSVLQQYADCGHLLRSGNDDSEPAAIFGRFLAGLIKSGKVLVFDVHTLNLPKDGEWESTRKRRCLGARSEAEETTGRRRHRCCYGEDR